MNTGYIYTACMSPTLNRSCALQCFEGGNAMEICNGIMFDVNWDFHKYILSSLHSCFYGNIGSCHIPQKIIKWCFLESILEINLHSAGTFEIIMPMEHVKHTWLMLISKLYKALFTIALAYTSPDKLYTHVTQFDTRQRDFLLVAPQRAVTRVQTFTSHLHICQQCIVRGWG